MIDTVILEIPRHLFSIFLPELFEPHCKRLLDPHVYIGKAFVKAIQNPTKKDVEEKNYKPRLTLMNRLRQGGREIVLKVEFSAPKLLFGNNFDELQDSDFSRLAEVLSKKLYEMGVHIRSADVASFPLTTVHFSKNIVLTDYTSVSMITNQLYKVDLTQKLDLDRTSFRNGGHCLHYHSNSFEVVFYDKVKDLEQSKKSEKRAIEKDNSFQTDIFNIIEYVKPFEVLRMEIRLCNKRKLKAVFEKLEIMDDLVFGVIFQASTARKVLRYFWSDLDKGLNVFAMNIRKPIDLLVGIKKQNASMSPQKMLQLLGAIVLIQDVGIRHTRDVLGLVRTKRHVWTRLKKELLAVNNLTEGENYKSISCVTKALEAFIPLKLSDYNINS